MSFYRVFGRNRPNETIDDYDGTGHRGPFRLSRSRQISDGGSRLGRLRCVIKHMRLRPLDRDLVVEMCSPRVSSKPL